MNQPFRSQAFAEKAYILAKKRELRRECIEKIEFLNSFFRKPLFDVPSPITSEIRHDPIPNLHPMLSLAAAIQAYQVKTGADPELHLMEQGSDLDIIKDLNKQMRLEKVRHEKGFYVKVEPGIENVIIKVFSLSDELVGVGVSDISQRESRPAVIIPGDGKSYNSDVTVLGLDFLGDTSYRFENGEPIYGEGKLDALWQALGATLYLSEGQMIPLNCSVEVGGTQAERWSGFGPEFIHDMINDNKELAEGISEAVDELQSQKHPERNLNVYRREIEDELAGLAP